MKRPGDSPAGRFSEQIASLREPPAIAALHPVAARFVYAMRLVAAYHRAKRDPAAELATRLGSIHIAIMALQLVDTIAHAWPEPVVVRRFCCGCLSHDELTIGALLDAGWRNDRDAFAAQLQGLVSSEQINGIWDDAMQLVLAEAASS